MKKQGKVSIRKTEIKRRQVDEMMAENKAQKVYLRLFKRVKRYPSEPVMLKHIALIHAEEETKKKSPVWCCSMRKKRKESPKSSN